MFLVVKGLLTPPEIARLNALARELKFVEGRLSNPANQTKVNMQADLGDPRYGESAQIVSQAFQRSREFRDFVFPKRIAAPLLTRYEPGMKYGAHADAAVMALPNGLLRSDVSCTVFVSDPSTYEGGELTVRLGGDPLKFKLPPGDCVLYPSTTLHEVLPVRSGVRLVSITFIESLIADHEKRDILYELNEIGALEGLNMKWENRVRFEVARQNLTRMWASV